MSAGYSGKNAKWRLFWSSKTIYVRFEKPETNRIFSEEVDRITVKSHTMDFFEQVTELRVEEARREGDEKAVRLLLQNTEFSPEKIADLVGVSVTFVKEVKEG